MSLIHSQEIMKLRIFTNLNKRRKGTFPKPAWNRLTTHSTQQETIPNPTNKHTPEQRLISLPNMGKS